jgi:hypothetical protein
MATILQISCRSVEGTFAKVYAAKNPASTKNADVVSMV